GSEREAGGMADKSCGRSERGCRMKGQTGAIMLDAYRELNARKLVWGVMILSVLVILACATVGVTDDSVSFLIWKIPDQVPNAKLFYKTLFSSLMIGFY